MKLYAPEYYKEFKCIADKCRHSCCIGWEIDIDEKTAEKYANLCGGYGETIKNSIGFDDVPHFILAHNDRCPHLNGKGLCNIILQKGEDFLCDICREHPRFYHDTSRGKEVGVGMACEEACRLILYSGRYAAFQEVGTACDSDPTPFDTLPLRQALYSILSDNSLCYADKLSKISEKYNISADELSDIEWQNVLDSLEYLDESHKALFKSYTFTPTVSKDHESPLENALAYFIFRHCTPAYDEEDFRASLGFALFCERLIASLISKGLPLEEAARTVSEELEYSLDNTDAIKLEFSF